MPRFSVVALTLVAAALSAACGAGEPAPAADPCTPVVQQAASMLEGAKNVNDTAKHLAALYYVTSQEQCFPPEVVASARAGIDVAKAQLQGSR